MSKCKYCGDPLPASRVRDGVEYCNKCGQKIPTVRQFVKVCNELKRIIYGSKGAGK